MLPKKILQFSSADQFVDVAEMAYRSLFPKAKMPEQVIHIITSDARNTNTHNQKAEEKSKQVLFAEKQWQTILGYATDPDLELIVVNRQQLVKTMLPDNIYQFPPASFRGKLLSLLYWRYRQQDVSLPKGLSIVTTDHVHNNPELLEAIVLEMAHRNNLQPAFLDWIENDCRFYTVYSDADQYNVCKK